MATPEKQYWSTSEDYYEYNLSGGSNNGFRIESDSKITVYMLRVFYYAPTGD